MLLQIQIMDYLLTISGSLILILLAIIGYFLSVFAVTVKDLKSIVEQLTVMLSVEQEKLRNFKDINERTHDSQSRDIEVLYNKVDQMEKDIIVLQTKVR